MTSVPVQDVWFDSDGDRCRGWLYLPDGAASPRPIVVLAHGLSVTHALHYWRAAEGLAEAGFAVLDFDPRRVGASEGEPRQVVDVQAQLTDLRSAIAYARTLDGVDPGRVALFGSSYGGGLAIDVAAADRDIAAVCLLAPQVDSRTNLPGMPLSWRLRVLRKGLADRAGRMVGRPPVLAPVFGPPGDKHAVLARDHAWDTLQEELRDDVGSEYRNEAAVWELVRHSAYRPGAKLGNVSCPVQMIIGTKDTVTPPQAQREAATACEVELVELDCDHFDPFRVSRRFSEVQQLQIAFLRKHLLSTSKV